ncbi:BlaI/MecI/CopY family transcriptional regulator [Streptomyces sp. NBC_00637]
MAALRAADGPLTPAAARPALGADLARTTVTTILTRPHAKGAVTRAYADRGCVHSPAQDAPGLTARRTHAELDTDADRSTALTRFAAGLAPKGRDFLRTLPVGDDGRSSSP